MSAKLLISKGGELSGVQTERINPVDVSKRSGALEASDADHDDLIEG